MRDWQKWVPDIGTQRSKKKQNPEHLVVADQIDSFVETEAEIQLKIATERELGRETSDWKTKVRPGEGYGTLVVVTDLALTLVVGNCRDPDVTDDYVKRLDLWDIEDIGRDESVLSSGLKIVDTDSVRYTIQVESTESLGDFIEYVRRSSQRWQIARPAFMKLNDTLSNIESSIANDSDKAEAANRIAREAISDIEDVGFHQEVTVPALEQRAEKARQAVTAAKVRGHVRRARSVLEPPSPPDETNATSNQATQCEIAESVLKEAVELITMLPSPSGSAEASQIAIVSSPEQIEEIVGYLGCRLEEACEAQEIDNIRQLLRSYAHLTTLAEHSSKTNTEETTEKAREAFATGIGRCDELINKLEDTGDTQYRGGNEQQAETYFQQAINIGHLRQNIYSEYASLAPNEAESDITPTLERVADKRDRSQWQWGGE